VNIWLTIAAAIWLGAMSWQDLKSKEISNWLTVPPVLLVAGWWAWRGEWAVLVLLVALIAITEVFDRLKLSPVVASSVLPAIAVGISYCASEKVTLVLVVWSTIWLAWMVHFFGEADAKVLMALVGYRPDVWLIGFLIGAQVLWSVYHLIRRYRAGALRVAVANAGAVPSEGELVRRGVPTMPAYAVAGCLYFFLLFGRVL